MKILLLIFVFRLVGGKNENFGSENFRDENSYSKISIPRKIEFKNLENVNFNSKNFNKENLRKSESLKSEKGNSKKFHLKNLENENLKSKHLKPEELKIFEKFHNKILQPEKENLKDFHLKSLEKLENFTHENLNFKNSSHKKLKVEIYLESECKFSKKFIQEQIWKNFEELKNFVEFSFIPSRSQKVSLKTPKSSSHASTERLSASATKSCLASSAASSTTKTCKCASSPARWALKRQKFTAPTKSRESARKKSKNV